MMESWFALAGGTLLVLLGLFKIIVSSARLLIWMVLLVAGLAGMGYAIRHQPTILETVGISSQWAQSIRGVVIPGK